MFFNKFKFKKNLNFLIISKKLIFLKNLNLKSLKFKKSTFIAKKNKCFPKY